MIRLLTLAALALAPLPLAAQALDEGYVAMPAAPSAVTRFVTRGTPWFPHGGGYVAPRAPERAATVCAMVAKKVGRLSLFTVAGKPFAEEELARCNAAVQ